MTIEKYINKTADSYKELHATGKALTVLIFLTHGILDYITTFIGYYATTSRGGSFAEVEQNSIIAHSGPLEMFFIIVGGALLMSILVVSVYSANQKIESKEQFNRRLADFLFGLIALFGVLLVANNLYHLTFLF